MPLADALLDISRGAVVAPAGCGKTQLITDALAGLGAALPVLVLTHTNAGVAALRARLVKAGVPAKAYRVLTMDGWAMRLASTFPLRSGIALSSLELRDTERDYPAIREAAVRLLEAGHLADLFRTTYDRIIVDEYQDCNSSQHALVRHASAAVPTVVLGDPLQAIFGFGGNDLPDWTTEVCADFPVSATMNIPWRWVNAETPALGEWLLSIRAPLSAGQSIDLATVPEAVEWVQLTGQPNRDRVLQLNAARTRLPDASARALILADSRKPAQQRQVASQTFGASTVESVELGDLILFAEALDAATNGTGMCERVVEFASAVMTNVGGSKFVSRLETLRTGRPRKGPNEAETAALRLCQDPSANRASDLLTELIRMRDVRVYRPTLLRAAVAMLRAKQQYPTRGFAATARIIREDVRVGRRRVARRAVGSTLLLKGLEADIAIVLNAATMDAKNLYVAMTRGAKRLVVCSASSQVGVVDGSQ